jgi:hypothetical protein
MLAPELKVSLVVKLGPKDERLLWLWFSDVAHSMGPKKCIWS